MAEVARLVGCGVQHVGGGSGQSERCLSGRWLGQCAESFVGGLLAGPQRAADLAPARSVCSRRVDELVEQLVAASAQRAAISLAAVSCSSGVPGRISPLI